MIWDLERDVLILRSRSFHGNPASRTYVIAILNIVFFPNPVSVPKFRRIPLCGWQSNPYPFNVSRIPHCLLVKFRDPGYTLHVRCQFNSSFFFQLIQKKRKTSGDGERVSKHLLFLIIVVWDGWDDRDDADFIMVTSLSYRIVPSGGLQSP